MAASAAAAPKGGEEQAAQGSKGGAAQSGKPESKSAETPAPGTAVEETLPGCVPAPDEPVVEEPAAEDPAAGEQPAAEAPATEDPASEAPATDAPATEEPATEVPDADVPAVDEPAPQDPCAPPAEPVGNGVNLSGRGKSAQKNPNVDAQGNLIPGAASGKTGSAEDGDTTEGTGSAEAAATEEVKAAKVAKVKSESRAQAKAERAKGEKGAYLIYVNGERLNLTPLARGGSTLVPFRRLAEFLGATVTWEPSTSTVIMEKGDTKVELPIGSAVAVVNGENVEMPVPSELVEGSTFVPLRFIATALGADVDYDAETGAITVITTDEAEAPAEEPEAPAEDPEAPAEDPEAPAEEPEAPAEEPEAPAEEPEAPAEGN
jgi:hypothetical protein